MQIQIFQISVNPERQEANREAVQKLADSISKLGLINPITVDREYTLIAGLHRLEAAKMLGWTEIECTVSDLNGLLAQLAEIDENYVRTKLDSINSGKLLLKRKGIYESLYPETKNGGDRRSEETRTRRARSDRNKAFTSDTAEKLGMSKRTVEENIQLAKDLTPEAQKIIQTSPGKVKKKDMLKISRLPPEQQEEAASQLATKAIQSVDEYHPTPAEPEKAEQQKPSIPPAVPYTPGGKHYASLEESIADLKNPNKDCSYTPDTLLADIDGFVATFHKNFAWYYDPFCTMVFPQISQVQFEFVRQRFSTIFSAVEDLINFMEKEIHK